MDSRIMRFTKFHSYQEIMRYPDMESYMRIFFGDNLLAMFPKAFLGKPLMLAEYKGETPWGDPFSIVVDQFLDAANMVLDIVENQERKCIPLWCMGDETWKLADAKEGGKESVFLVTPAKKYKSRRPAVIICPGGGYADVCFSGEGNPLLHHMEAQGYGAFVLKYRVAPNRYPDPQKDLAFAIQYVRANADEYNVNPDDLTVMGFSAGGHLSASTTALHREMEALLAQDRKDWEPEVQSRFAAVSARPDKVCLCYPVISFEEEAHEGSFENLTGADEQMRKMLSAENLAGTDYPPTFLWTCLDDETVPPSNTIRMAKRLRELQVPCDMQLYQSGGHGCALAFSKDAWEWSFQMLGFLSGVCGTDEDITKM